MNIKIINNQLAAKWLVLFCIFIFIFLIGTETFLISPVLPQISSDFGVSVVVAANVVTTYVLIYALLGPFLGNLSDFKGRRLLILAGISIFLLGNILAAISHSLLLLMIARGITGIGAAAAGPSMWAFLGDTTHSSIRGRIISFGMAAFSLGQVLGVPLGSYVTSKFGWQYAFFALAVVSALILPLLIITLTKYSYEAKPITFLKAFAFLRVFKEKNIRLALLVTFFWAAANLGSYTYLGAYLKSVYSLNTSEIGSIIIFVGVGSFFGALLGGKVSDYWRRTGKDESLLPGIWALLLGVAVLCMMYSTNLLISMICLMIWFLASGAFVTSIQTLLTIIMPTLRGSAISINNSVMYAGTAAGVWVLGILMFGAWKNIGLVALVCAGIAWLFAYLLSRNNLNLSEN